MSGAPYSANSTLVVAALLKSSHQALLESPAGDDAYKIPNLGRRSRGRDLLLVEVSHNLRGSVRLFCERRGSRVRQPGGLGRWICILHFATSVPASMCQSQSGGDAVIA